jgi:hypothetical protein
MKRAFAVSETEYPDEGCALVVAFSEKGAKRRYRRWTGERARGVGELTPLTAEVCTAHEALVLWRSGG